MTATRNIAVFDVCGTITRTNNTSDFVGFVLRRDSPWRFCLFVLVRMLGALRNLFGIRSAGRRGRLSDRQIALLQGYSCARLREMSVLYVDALFARNLLNPAILDAMRSEQEQGKTLYLISAAIDPPIIEMARRLGVEGCFCSELEVVDGRCTGRLQIDLLGNKRTVLAKIPGDVDWHGSSVYSDNVDDADFMAAFGRRHAVLHAPGTERLWERGTGEFHFIANYGGPARHRDTNAVTASAVTWTYAPLLYYMVSRFRREGLGTPLLRELVPATLAACLFTNAGAFSLVLVPASWLMFYCVYEIGGLVNDLHAGRETPGRGTHRISPGVHIHVGLFVAIRAAVIALLLAWLPIRGYPVWIYLGALGLCLAVYLIHTFLSGSLRVISFTLLKLCRNVIPLLVLVSYTPPATFIWLCTVFFLVDAPWRVWAYCRAQWLIEAGPSVWRVRCAALVLLWGPGAAIYVLDGSPLLLAVASYHVVIECLWLVRATLSWSAADYRDLVA